MKYNPNENAINKKLKEEKIKWKEDKLTLEAVTVGTFSLSRIYNLLPTAYPSWLFGLWILHKIKNRRKEDWVTKVTWLANKDKIEYKIKNMINVRKRQKKNVIT